MTCLVAEEYSGEIGRVMDHFMTGQNVKGPLMTHRSAIDSNAQVRMFHSV